MIRQEIAKIERSKMTDETYQKLKEYILNKRAEEQKQREEDQNIRVEQMKKEADQRKHESNLEALKRTETEISVTQRKLEDNKMTRELLLAKLKEVYEREFEIETKLSNIAIAGMGGAPSDPACAPPHPPPPHLQPQSQPHRFKLALSAVSSVAPTTANYIAAPPICMHPPNKFAQSAVSSIYSLTSVPVCSTAIFTGSSQSQLHHHHHLQQQQQQQQQQVFLSNQKLPAAAPLSGAASGAATFKLLPPSQPAHSHSHLMPPAALQFAASSAAPSATAAAAASSNTIISSSPNSSSVATNITLPSK